MCAVMYNHANENSDAYNAVVEYGILTEVDVKSLVSDSVVIKFLLQTLCL